MAGGRAWPHKNGPADVAMRRRTLEGLPAWHPDDRFVFDWPCDPEPFLAMQECTVGYVALPVSTVPVWVDMGEYVLDASGSVREEGRAAEEVYVPLAHTEGSLSASLLRGAVATRTRGIHTYILADGITRDCCFVLDDAAESVSLSRWIAGREAEMQAWLDEPDNPFARASRGRVAPISRHARLQRVDSFVLGPMCHVLFRFTTGDACGPNMITRNAYALSHGFLAERYFAPKGVQPRRFVLEANMGGDKKPSYQYFHEGHGKSVLAEAVIDAATLGRVLRVRPEDLLDLQTVGLHGSHASGMASFGFTPASAVAAVFAATGQDLGMVGTSSMAHGTVHATEVDGAPALHFSLRLPGLEVGTVGGGTALPHARAYLRMMGCEGKGRVYRFAQIVVAAALCLEISAGAAMATSGSRNFYQAHLERGGLRLRQAEQGIPGDVGAHPRLRERGARV